MGDENRPYRVSDEIETIRFREQIMSAIHVLQAGQTTMHDCIDRIQKSFIEYKQGIGARIENHQDRLTRIEVSLGIMVKVTWIFVTCSIGILGAAAYSLILK